MNLLFYFPGKKAIWKRVAENKEAINLLKEATLSSMERFVIKFVYNDKSSTSLHEMRRKNWQNTKKKNKKTLARIGPDQSSNELRTKRVLYQINVIESFSNPHETKSPLHNGNVALNGMCVPQRSNKPVLPSKLGEHALNFDFDKAEEEESDDEEKEERELVSEDELSDSDEENLLDEDDDSEV